MPDPVQANPKDKPDYKSAGYDQVASDCKLVRDMSGGTKAMRQAAETYLPKEKREDPIDYRIRLQASVLFDAYLRTVQSLVGVVFKKEIVVGAKVPQQIKNDIEDIDLAGNHLDVFAKRLFSDQFEGYAFILVEMQPALPAGSTLADERATNRRPYWVSYKADQAVNWRTERVNGKQEFTQITFREDSMEPAGKYGEVVVTRYRTFRTALSSQNNPDGFVEWELNRFNPAAKTDDEKFIFEKAGQLTLKRIPVAVAGELLKPPPLLGLAYLNISHWRNTSDQENILHITRVPQLVRYGASEEQKTKESVAGVSGIWDLPSKTESGLEWLEIKNDGATKAGRDHILDIENRMGMEGLSQLAAHREVKARTATEVRQDYEHTHSELSTMARSLKDAIELALTFHAEYSGLSEGGSVELGVAEESLILTPQHMQMLLAALLANKVPLTVFLTAVLNLLDNAGVLAEDQSVDEWIKQIDETTKVQQAVGLPAIASKNLAGAGQPIQRMFGATGIGATQ